MNYSVVVLAAGQGKRMQAGKNKQFIMLEDDPVIIHTLRVFENDSSCDEMIVVVNENEVQEMKQLFQTYKLKKLTNVVVGGAERQDSVYEGLKVIDQPSDRVVLIHDGARPFVQERDLHRLVDRVDAEHGAVLAVQVTDTVKKVNEELIQETIPRDRLWAVQTPQAFPFALIKTAYAHAKEANVYGTDDASLVERLGKHVRIVEGSRENMKLTTPYDIKLATILLELRAKEAGQ
ncbi:2-C-methyl-D-erythritol 4-phosphate cytidylyltransferase [Geomicrobium sp. JCM 19039]|uniref:2-C-methyl-D-erythritol 4-phosphate cytidylyltransferase n=1 Tax=Geomicrobium sp. JCM 19039 TaxID=1460636 RepID=UPI00045F156A|nr:2-C-methyl-D-erythritol 4-phosphate cytidylyltransferase [Geomicrobium sp. JCM 19039]GAK13859.1 2-C-methyl-D-erythritol 4-phosphate cytidylyltransferase [Geomicrobium sp. JCM 19039]